MEDKKKKNDDYKALKPEELEASGGMENPGMEDLGACPNCRSKRNHPTGKKVSYGPFGIFTADEVQCDDCGKLFLG